MHRKQALYLTASTALFVLLSYLAHAFLELWYLGWAEETGRAIVWTKHLGIGPCALPWWAQYGLLAAGLLGGFLIGRVWWRFVYERPHPEWKSEAWFLRVVFVILAVGLGAFAYSKAEPEVHYHAAFQVYVDGAVVDFSATQYMHVEPCGLEDEEEEETPEHVQLEKAHLHDGVGDVVHVHREGAVWADLFLNVGYVFAEPVAGYVNGSRVDSILTYPIEEHDRVLILSNTAVADIRTLFDDVPSVERIKAVENAGESC